MSSRRSDMLSKPKQPMVVAAQMLIAAASTNPAAIAPRATASRARGPASMC